MAARQAGLTVGAKAVQLWQVGAGLPLDALKKGAINRFVCPYRLGEAEIPPLLGMHAPRPLTSLQVRSQPKINISFAHFV